MRYSVNVTTNNIEFRVNNQVIKTKYGNIT